jgi:hypothetical protein
MCTISALIRSSGWVTAEADDADILIVELFEFGIRIAYLVWWVSLIPIA